MRYILILTIFLNLYASQDQTNERKLKEKHIKKQIEDEKRYKQEQKFYQYHNYDFKGAEVDDKSLETIPEQPEYNDDFDMDHVYD